MQHIPAKWRALGTAYLLFIASAVLLFMFPPLLPEIREDIALDDVQVGWMQGLYALPALLFAFIGGHAVDRIDSRISGIAAGLFMVAGNLLFTLGGSVVLMLSGRFLIGIGAIIVNLAAARMITLWFPRHQAGSAMSVIHTAWPLAAGLSYNTLVVAGQNLGWVWLSHALTFGTAAIALVFMLLAPRDPEMPPAQAHAKAGGGRGSIPGELWITAIAWFCFTATMISILTFGAEHLYRIGFDYAAASGVVGALMLVAAPASLFAGWIMDRRGRLKYYMVFSALISGICFFGFASGFQPLVMMLCAGIGAAFMPIAVYTMPGVIMPRERIGLAFGVILTFSNFGNTIGPVASGWINELTGGPVVALFVVAGLISFSGLLGLLLRDHRLAVSLTEPAVGKETP